MSQTINIALAGSGTFAQNAYLPALLANTSTINLHSLWSRSSSSTDALLSSAKSIGLLKSDADVKVYNGTDANGLDAVLADPEVDAVAFILPITAQPPLITKAWQAGKHVLSEKPVGKDTETAKELIRRYESEFKPKGLIWRVAENYNHDATFREAAQILRNTPALGPILYWQLNVHAYCPDGSKYQKTEWRTVPDYQGGFLLDGGVHFAALVRTVLPTPPSRITANAALHRTHLLPHDTILGFALPPVSSTIEPHGPPTTSIKAIRTVKDVPGPIGKSSPHGSVSISWAAPDLEEADRLPTSLSITCLNGLMVISGVNGVWTLEVRPGAGSGVERVKKTKKSDGVEVELREWAEAIAARKAGKAIEREDSGKPSTALWDLAFIEACLTSEGKEISIDELASL